ncbi:MAG TPA: FimV/HubP family polar landmark protein, partial [Burkholderiaceae bacterium]
MKTISLKAGRFALTGVAAAAIGLIGSNAHALGLGRVAVQSSLGESLRAEIDVTSLAPEEAASLRVRIAPPEAYRAAGVDYNAALTGTQAVLQRRADGRAVLQITSDRTVQEPFVDVILELTWSSGRLVREFTLLLDPPTTRMAQAPAPAAPATAPSISAAPTPAPAAPAAEAKPQPERRAAPSRPAVTAAPSEGAVRPAPAGAASDDEYRVRSGDTLSRIASRTQRPGASLDQMLVALFRGNSQAFIDNNMNRLKAGSVLNVPS